MNPLTLEIAPDEIIYPESDGQPIAENTVQFRYIATIVGGLDAQYRDDPNVFVAGDLLWYPVEGDPTISQAPDAMVAFGRPKGDRRSYLQWKEGGIAPQVVFEILSPSNRGARLREKFEFYQRYGVEEYYVYDPDYGTLEGWIRQGDQLRPIPDMTGWVSPRLGIRFELRDGELLLYHPDGRRFLSYLELFEQQQREAEERERERRERQQAQLRLEAEQRERQQAQLRLEAEQREKEALRRQLEQLTAQLRSLGIEPPG